MKFSLGRKLGFGFGVIILLMVTSAIIVYAKLSDVNHGAAVVGGRAVPAAQACDRMLIDLNRAIASLRGYLLFGDNDAQAAQFRGHYEEAWREVDRQYAIARELIDTSYDASIRGKAKDIDADLKALREIQDRSLGEAFQPGNVPYRDMLLDVAAPNAMALFDAYSGMIENTNQGTMTDERRAMLLALANARGHLGAADAALRTAVLMKDVEGARGKYNDAFQGYWSEYLKSIEEVERHRDAMTTSEQRAWEDLLRLEKAYSSVPSEMIALRSHEDYNHAEYLLESAATPLARKIRTSAEDLADTLQADVAAQMGSLNRATTAMTITLIVSSVLTVVLGSLIAGVLSRRVVVSIQAVVERARRVAEGDLTGDPLQVNSDDEIRLLASSFNDMLDGLRNLTGQIGQVTANINSSSSEILAAARQQASSTREQAATVHQISSTMEELSQSGEQVRARANDVASIADNTSKATADGIRAVSETAETMETIREQVEQVAQNIVALSERTQTIGEIIATVNDMAEQSNLLALNASIESVSAGEQGSRFGVVASEMKNLADQAKQSTTQVRAILGEIQKGINTSVMLTEEAVKRVAAGKSRSELTETAIRDATRATNQSVEAFQQITGATNQQLIGFEQVTQGMSDIRIASEQTAASTAQLERSAADLNALSTQLRSAVERYRL